VYTTPENIWGYDLVTSAYGEKPEVSRNRIIEHMKALYPEVTEKQLAKL